MRSLLALAMLGAAHASSPQCDSIVFDLRDKNGDVYQPEWSTQVFRRTSEQTDGRDRWEAQFVSSYDNQVYSRYLIWSCGRWYFWITPTVSDCQQNSIRYGMSMFVDSSEIDPQYFGASAGFRYYNKNGAITQTCFTPDDCATNDGSTVTEESCACGDAICGGSQYCDAGTCETTKRCVVEDASAATGEDCRCGGSTCDNGQFCDVTQDGGACGPWAKGAASVADACALCAENPVEYVQAGMC